MLFSDVEVKWSAFQNEAYIWTVEHKPHDCFMVRKNVTLSLKNG